MEILASYGQPAAALSPEEALRHRRARRESRRVATSSPSFVSPSTVAEAPAVVSPPCGSRHSSLRSAVKQQSSPVEWGGGGDEREESLPSSAEKRHTSTLQTAISDQENELRARQDARKSRARSRSKSIQAASAEGAFVAASREALPSSAASPSSAPQYRSASASVRRRRRTAEERGNLGVTFGTPAAENQDGGGDGIAHAARQREAAREALHKDHHLHEQAMRERYLDAVSAVSRGPTQAEPTVPPAARCSDEAALDRFLEKGCELVAAASSSASSSGERTSALPRAPLMPPFALQTSAIVATAAAAAGGAPGDAGSSFALASSLAEDLANLHIARLEAPSHGSNSKLVTGSGFAAVSDSSSHDPGASIRAAADAKERLILGQATQRLQSGVDQFTADYIAAMESAEKARRFAEEEERRRKEAEAAEAERKRREATEAAERAKAEAEAAERKNKEDEEAARKRQKDEQEAASKVAAATTTAAAQQQQAGPSSSSSAAPAAQSSATLATPQDAISVAKELIRDLTASFSVVASAMQLPADAYGDGRDPSELMKAAPDDGNAGRIWLSLRRWANRIIGTLADTKEAARNISAVFDDAARLDASTNGGSGIAALQAVGPRYGSAAGPYSLYAFDAMVAIACTKASELANGSIGENLTVSFSISRVLVFLMAKHPLFLRRFLGTFYRAVPSLVPSAHFLPGSGATSGIAVQDLLDKDSQYAARVPKLCAMFAAVLQEHTGGLKENARPPNSNRNPHPVKHAWSLIARILNAASPTDGAAMKPLFVPGAEIVLHQLLLYCGFELHQSYRKQALKLFQSIAVDYLPRLEAHLQAASNSKSKNTSIEVIRTLLCGAAGPFVPSADHIPVVRDLPIGRELPEDAQEDEAAGDQ